LVKNRRHWRKAIGSRIEIILSKEGFSIITSSK